MAVLFVEQRKKQTNRNGATEGFKDFWTSNTVMTIS